MVYGKAPEIQILIFPHGLEHLPQRAHGAHKGRVRHDDLVIFRQLLPAVEVERRLVGPYIEPLVFPHDDRIGELLKSGAALRAELAVADNDQLCQVLMQICEIVGDEIIHIAVFFVEEKDA